MCQRGYLQLRPSFRIPEPSVRGLCPLRSRPFENGWCAAVDRELLTAEMRLAEREVRGRDDDEDRARVYELRRARGRLN